MRIYIRLIKSRTRPCTFDIIYIYIHLDVQIYIHSKPLYILYRDVCVHTRNDNQRSIEHNAHTPRKTGPFVGHNNIYYIIIYFLPARDFFKGPNGQTLYIIIIIIIGRDVCYYVSLLLDTIIILVCVLVYSV